MEGMEDSDSCLKLEIKVPVSSEEHNTNPKRLRFLCDHICSFSSKEYGVIDSAERSESKRKLCGLIIFCIIVMIAEIFGGIKANSLAVLTDAAHVLSDIAGFAISLLTVWVSGWNATPQQSFGFNRLEVVGALLSVQLIWLISVVLIYEAIDRILHQKREVNGTIMLAISAFGFLVNFVMIFWIGHEHSHHCHSHESHHGCEGSHRRHRHHHHHHHEVEELCADNDGDAIQQLVPTSPKMTRILNINLQGAYLHIMTDLIQSAGVMIAGFIIWLKPEWLVVDLLSTLLFSFFALSTTIPILKDIICILTERAPDALNVALIESGLKGIKGLRDVHDLHVWAITSGKFVLTCHAVIDPGTDPSEIISGAKKYCEEAFRIHHVTIQIEQDDDIL